VASPVRTTPKRAAPVAVPVRLPITLGQFLKVAGLASSGGEAKALIGRGSVRVNGEPEGRRGRKLATGDVVQVDAVAAQVAVVGGPAASDAADAPPGAPPSGTS
jgi:ribosome-associated protein